MIREALGIAVALLTLWPHGGLRSEDLSEGVLDAEGEAGYDDVLADLEHIDLNTATAGDLAVIPRVSERDARLIVDFRRRRGPFRKVDDLFGIEGLSAETVEAIASYAVVSEPSPFFPIRVESRLRIFRKMPGGGAFRSSAVYQRVELSLGQKSHFLLITEKDPGERSAADLAIGYAELRQLPGFDQVVIGDFRPGFAQGLIFGRWSRSFVGADIAKGGGTSSVGYRSTVENGALRGVFARKSVGDREIFLFLSRSRLDAALSDEGKVVRLMESGLHVTAKERSRADVLSETLVGGRLLLNPRKALKVGATFSLSSFDPPFERDDLERGHFDFEGSESRSLGVDWDLDLLNLNFFGELAFSEGLRRGAVLGMILDFENMRINLLLRDYGRDFHTFHGSGFSFFGEDNNERGILSRINWRPRRGTRVAAFFDQHRRPWRRYSLAVPSWGESFGARVEQTVFNKFKVVLGVRSKHSQTSQDGELMDRLKRNLRLDLAWRPERRLRLRGRIERSLLQLGDGPAEGGVLLFGDFRVKPSRALTVEGRLTFFDTDSYGARIYEFENDLRGVASFRPLSGRGSKWYLLARLNLGESALSAKYWSKEVLPRGRNDDTERESRLSLQIDFALSF